MNAILDFFNQTEKNGCIFMSKDCFLFYSLLPDTGIGKWWYVIFWDQKNNDLLLQSCQSTTAGMCNRDKLSKLVSYSRGTFWTFWTPCVIYQCFLFKIMKLAESLNNFWIGPHQFNLAESLNNRSTLKSFLSVSIFFFFQAHMFYLKLTPHTEHIYLAVKMLLS